MEIYSTSFWTAEPKFCHILQTSKEKFPALLYQITSKHEIMSKWTMYLWLTEPKLGLLFMTTALEECINIIKEKTKSS